MFIVFELRFLDQFGGSKNSIFCHHLVHAPKASLSNFTDHFVIVQEPFFLQLYELIPLDLDFLNHYLRWILIFTLMFNFFLGLKRCWASTCSKFHGFLRFLVWDVGHEQCLFWNWLNIFFHIFNGFNIFKSRHFHLFLDCRKANRIFCTEKIDETNSVGYRTI